MFCDQHDQSRRMLHVYSRRISILLLLDIKCGSNISLLIFCLDSLSIAGSVVLKFPTVIVLLLISPLISISICLICFIVWVLIVYMLWYVLNVLTPLSLTFVFCYLFGLRFILSDISKTVPLYSDFCLLKIPYSILSLWSRMSFELK